MFFLSFFLVGLGQPLFSSYLSFFAGFLGYALFWYALFSFSTKRAFYLGWGWFFLVQLIQLKWMVSFEYQSVLILFVYVILALLLGVQFGIFTAFIHHFFTKKKAKSFLLFVTASFLWVFFEEIRLFVLSGFSWNPVGLALSANVFSRQMASLFGVYGLSFWVIFTNLWGAKALFTREKKVFFLWGICALTPFLWGKSYLLLQSQKIEKGIPFSVLLVQTALRPEEKSPHFSWEKFLSPYVQWKRIFEEVQKQKNKLDLVVLPEIALPFGTFQPVYPLKEIEALWKEVFSSDIHTFAPLSYSYGEIREGKFFVSNAFILQSLANAFSCEWVAGLETYDPFVKRGYNAAFYFAPGKEEVFRYEKRVLVPIGEYIPYRWAKKWAREFGIEGSFSFGKTAKIFSKKNPFSVSICYEETYPYLIREGRKLGAEFLVNLSNDAWFPKTTLAMQHYFHGMLRSVENGVFCLRATNTGVTAAVDPFGRERASFLKEDPKREETYGSLLVSFPMASLFTLYTFWGELPLLLGGFFCVVIFGFHIRNRSCSKKGNWLTFLKT